MPVESPVIDRSLNDFKFRNLTKLKKPNWVEMAHQVKQEIEVNKHER